MIEISTAFPPSSETVKDFYHRPGASYYIPLYQREYSWDRENIDQLMEDICKGVDSTLADDDTIRFLGTVILVSEKNPHANIRPQDTKALPTRIDNVIDGQQRISTIALLSCLLYQRVSEKKRKLPSDSLFDGLREEIDSKLELLEEIFSVDIKRGKPKRKPVVIRGSEDCWTFDGPDDENYGSDVSLLIAKYIRSILEAAEFPSVSKDTLVGKNVRQMNKWLNNIEKAYDDEELFPSARKIISKIKEEYIWSYSRPELVEYVSKFSSELDNNQKKVAQLIHLFAFIHFLLDRCCFNIISPVSEVWAFDMFQSLNASGTPLTALETFKPLVVNTVNVDGGSYKGSSSESSFKNIDQLMGSMTNASTKSKLTNDFLTTLALVWQGSKLSSQFSSQRKWLIDTYGNLQTLDDKNDFIKVMGNLSLYWDNVLGFDPSVHSTIKGTNKANEEDRSLASVCALYLRDAGHKMANTILSRFYFNVLAEKEGSVDEFISACKALAAFFTIWRSASGNSGLDDYYRKGLRGDDELGVFAFSYIGDDENFSSHRLKKYLKEVLDRKKLTNKQDWLSRAKEYLRFNNAKIVCKFALFVSAHDTEIDLDNTGLMKIGKNGYYQYLEPKKWVSSDFKTIEHIAPRNISKESNWDVNLYKEEEYQLIGNLTLLPVDINSSAGNKNWNEKLIYFLHLSEMDDDNLKILEKKASENGVDLSEDTIELLKNASHKHHIKPIVEVGFDGSWDLDLVKKRSERMCEILWDRVTVWLD